MAYTLIEGKEYDYLTIVCVAGLVSKLKKIQLKNIRLSREDKWGMKHVETEPRWPVQAETVVSRHLYALHMYSYSPDPRSLDGVEV